MRRHLLGFALLVGLTLGSCMPLGSATPAPPTDTSAPPSATVPLPTATDAATPTTGPTLTATLPPEPTLSPTPTPPPTIASWSLVYHPQEGRSVAAVRWSADGKTLYYALSPAPSAYLLDWYAYDPISQGSRALHSPNYGFADLWRKIDFGFPRNTGPFSEVLGFTSPDFERAIYPNAGFPEAVTNPNYIFVIIGDSTNRQRVLGPIFRGTVGRAAWIDSETRVIFDYRYEEHTIIYLADLVSGRTDTLFELPVAEAEWRVSPDDKYLLVPQNGRSELIPLDGDDALSLETPGGMARPEWSSDSRTIYFWAGVENRILSYSLTDRTFHPVVVRRDLEPNSPLPPVYGMPFSVSPGGGRVAFWWENWVWVIELAPGR